jgi:hypothetical protein
MGGTNSLQFTPVDIINLVGFLGYMVLWSSEDMDFGEVEGAY